MILAPRYLYFFKMPDDILSRHTSRFIIRTSGFVFYFFSFLLITFGWVFLLAVKQVIEKHGFDKPYDWRAFLGFIIFPWMLFYLYKFLTGQKIEIAQNRFISSILLPTNHKTALIPTFITNEIDLTAIESVTIATIKYFEAHANDYADEKLADMIKQYRSLVMAPAAGGIPIPVPMGFVTGGIPLIFIASKNNNQNITITTKPFSRNAIKQLISELRMRNIPVTVEESLKLA